MTTAVPTDGPASGRRQTLEFKLLSFDRNNGQLHWQRTATRGPAARGNARDQRLRLCVPLHGRTIRLCPLRLLGLYCYSMSGELVWKRDDFGKMQTFHEFGEGSSPTLAGNMILVPVGPCRPVGPVRARQADGQHHLENRSRRADRMVDAARRRARRPSAGRVEWAERHP